MSIIEKLREQYKDYLEADSIKKANILALYKGMRILCLDCNLLFLNEIDKMEKEVELNE